MSHPTTPFFLVVFLATLTAIACVDMPGDRGETCSRNGFCASGLWCNPDTKTCENPPPASDCTDGATQACGSDKGVCKKGVQTCQNGVWGECGGESYVPQSDEIPCDGVDNNCDGVEDEGSCGPTAICDTTYRLCRQRGAVICGYLTSSDSSDKGSMCLVDAGSYSIGDPTTPTSLPAFFIDQYEVSNLRYEAFFEAMSGAAQHLPSCRVGDRGWSASPPRYDSSRAQHPVVCVTRVQAQAFCAWAGKRLPTAQEWEAAARGDDDRVYPWAQGTATDSITGGECNCADLSCHDVYPRGTCTTGLTTCPDTAPVDSLTSYASPLGTLHQIGNVAEWIASDSTSDPLFVRGGSWNDYINDPDQPLDPRVDTLVNNDNVATVGFRCAMDVSN